MSEIHLVNNLIAYQPFFLSQTCHFVLRQRPGMTHARSIIRGMRAMTSRPFTAFLSVYMDYPQQLKAVFGPSCTPTIYSHILEQYEDLREFHPFAYQYFRFSRPPYHTWDDAVLYVRKQAFEEYTTADTNGDIPPAWATRALNEPVASRQSSQAGYNGSIAQREIDRVLLKPTDERRVPQWAASIRRDASAPRDTIDCLHGQFPDVPSF